MPRYTTRFTALACAALVAACASPPTTVHLTLRSDYRLNPDETGQPNPVQAHIFMLKASETFSNTDYFQFADKEKSVLGGDLLAEDNEIIHPGQVRQVSLPVPPGTKVVAVSAAYRNIDKATWRAVTPLAAGITAGFGPQAVALTADK